MFLLKKDLPNRRQRRNSCFLVLCLLHFFVLPCFVCLQHVHAFHCIFELGVYLFATCFDVLCSVGTSCFIHIFVCVLCWALNEQKMNRMAEVCCLLVHARCTVQLSVSNVKKEYRSFSADITHAVLQDFYLNAKNSKLIQQPVSMNTKTHRYHK